ncbi:MAG TPA: hypothetical protein VH351_16455 [Bryobacteraceae bacterium]|jgi:hypothetical protein|nr:hypothetical protein [Bryobacteraceae bacterium]
MLLLWITGLTLAGTFVLPPVYFLVALFVMDRRLNRHVEEIRAALNLTTPPHPPRVKARDSENPAAMGTDAHPAL